MAGPDIRSLDIGMLRTFDALMRERSVSRAATRLFLSQPAVSASLKRLRDVFDDPLFLREAHGIVPTARALALAPHVEQVLADVTRLMNVDRPFDPARSDRIFRLAGSDHASLLVLPALCRLLQALGSRIRLFWESPGFSTLPERLRKGDLQLALLPRPFAPDELDAHPLYEDDYVLAARRDHPRLADAGATLDAFCELPHAVLGHGPSTLDDHIDLALVRAGRQRHAQVAVTSFSQLAQLLGGTDIVAVLPRRVAKSHAGTRAWHALPLDVPRYTLYAACDRRMTDDPGTAWLREAIVRGLPPA